MLWVVVSQWRCDWKCVCPWEPFFDARVTYILRISMIIHLEDSFGDLHCWYSFNVQAVCVQIIIAVMVSYVTLCFLCLLCLYIRNVSSEEEREARCSLFVDNLSKVWCLDWNTSTHSSENLASCKSTACIYW